MPERSARLRLLNNYAGGGIGDFGRELAAQLRQAGIPLVDEETRPDGSGAAAQAARCREELSPLLLNLGLTAWGRSGLRNYRAFSILGRRPLVRSTIVIVHHAIEMLDSAETGYRVTRFTKWGAHRALAQLAKYELITFSPRLTDLLRGSYGARSVWLTPMPSEPPRRMEYGGGQRVLSCGYLAPYKGIDVTLDVAALLKDEAQFYLVGRPHRVLSEDESFRTRVREWSARAKSVGVAMPGFLDAESLDAAMRGRAIGLLPYTSASGASASFRLFSSRGVPVVTSDLPEFRYLQAEGAGVLTVAGGAERYASALRTLRDSPERWDALASKQREFAARHSWSAFVTKLIERHPAIRPGPE